MLHLANSAFIPRFAVPLAAAACAYATAYATSCWSVKPDMRCLATTITCVNETPPGSPAGTKSTEMFTTGAFQDSCNLASYSGKDGCNYNDATCSEAVIWTEYSGLNCTGTALSTLVIVSSITHPEGTLSGTPCQVVMNLHDLTSSF